jgi:hypothetical protein
MQKSLQSALVALAAGSIFVFASAAMAQDASVGLSPLFEVQPQVAQEYILTTTLDDLARASFPAHMGRASSCALHSGGDARPRPCLQA